MLDGTEHENPVYPVHLWLEFGMVLPEHVTAVVIVMSQLRVAACHSSNNAYWRVGSVGPAPISLISSLSNIPFRSRCRLRRFTSGQRPSKFWMVNFTWPNKNSIAYLAAHSVHASVPVHLSVWFVTLPLHLSFALLSNCQHFMSVAS